MNIIIYNIDAYIYNSFGIMKKAKHQLEYNKDEILGSEEFRGLVFRGKMEKYGEVAVKRIQLVKIKIERIPKFKEDFVYKLSGDDPSHILRYLLAEEHEYFLYNFFLFISYFTYYFFFTLYKLTGY